MFACRCDDLSGASRFPKVVSCPAPAVEMFAEEVNVALDGHRLAVAAMKMGEQSVHQEERVVAEEEELSARAQQAKNLPHDFRLIGEVMEGQG